MARILIEPSGDVLCDSASFARTHRERARGLIGRPALTGNEALLFEKTPQVHTFGMSYPLDVVFCDRDFKVLHVNRNLVPRRVSRWVFRARYTIEMKAGSVPPSVSPGVGLRMEEDAPTG